MIDQVDIQHLERCIELAETALNAGDQPFGSLLVAKDGRVLLEERNLIGSGDKTQHPEFALARWAANHLGETERKDATVYTSGEHCPMCSAAHGWVGLGRIVYASSSEQFSRWSAEFGASAGPVRALSIQDVIPGTLVDGPVEAMAQRVRELHLAYHQRHESGTA